MSMVLLALPKRSRPIRAFSATPHDGQRPCRMLAEDPGGTQPRAAYPGAAAQTRVVSLAGIRLDSRKSVRPFKGIICDDISEIAVDTVIAVNGFLIDLSCCE